MNQAHHYFRKIFRDNALAFPLLFVIWFLPGLLQGSRPWYSCALSAAGISALIVLVIATAGWVYEAGIRYFQKRSLRHPNVKPFIERGFAPDESGTYLEGILDGVPLKIYWQIYNPKVRKTHALYVEAFFREPFPAVRPTERGLIWHRGGVAAVLESGYVALPPSEAIEGECTAIVAAVMKYNLTPISSREWDATWRPVIEREEFQRKEAEVTKRINFLGLKIELRNPHRVSRSQPTR